MPDSQIGQPTLPRSTLPHAGMPELGDSAGDISWFEFANPRWFYIPIYAYCSWLSLKYRGLTHPIGANPDIPFSGFVGESKTEVLDTVSGRSRDLIAPYITVKRPDHVDPAFISRLQGRMAAHGLTFPVVLKPDLGMRGAGVQVAKSQAYLLDYASQFPAGGRFLVQQLVSEEGEAGIFYVRHPDWDQGRVISLTLKYFPRVFGNGKSTLSELIDQDARASQLRHLYEERLKGRLGETIPVGESVRLAFAGNHCRGTIFRNGNDHITPEMTKAFDRVARDMGEFYVGRFDVRFGDFDALKAGLGFRIIEVNGAGGEATHIWDARTRLRDAYKTLMTQFDHIYAIGAKNKKRGFQRPTFGEFIKAWQYEKRLTGRYPITH